MSKPVTIPLDASFKTRFTTAEFGEMTALGAFGDMKVELVHGELERMNPPHNAHASRQAQIVIRLARFVSEALLRGGVGIDLGSDTVMGCDAVVLRRPVDQAGLLKSEDMALAIEIAETTIARDLGIKRLAYAGANIPFYWVVDGERSVTHVFSEPVLGDYAVIGTVRFGEPLAVPGTDRTIVID